MKKIFSIITIILIILTSNSCSNNENTDNYEITKEGISVIVNGTKKTFTIVSVEQYIHEQGTSNEYISLLVKGQINANSSERISFSLLKGKINPPIEFLTYVDSDDRIYYFERSTNGGSFNINITTNDYANNLLEGKFYGTLQENGGGTLLKFEKGSFSIQY